MKSFLSFAFAVALTAGSSVALAQTANTMSGASNSMSGAGSSMSGSMAGHPTCPANDPAVGVNTATKTYMTKDQMKAKTAGMTTAQIHDMMSKNHVSMMCTSKAEAMGAKPMAATKM